MTWEAKTRATRQRPCAFSQSCLPVNIEPRPGGLHSPPFLSPPILGNTLPSFLLNSRFSRQPEIGADKFHELAIYHRALSVCMIYAFGRHNYMMINDATKIADDDDRGISAEIEHTTLLLEKDGTREQRAPVTCVLFKVFDWNGDDHGDVWEIKRRLTLAEAKELSRWLAKRVSEHQPPLRA